MKEYKLTNYGDATICVTFSKSFSESAWKKTHALAMKLKKFNYNWILSIIPTYTTVLIHFNIVSIKTEKVIKVVEDAIKTLKPNLFQLGEATHFIPVIYGGSYGPDLPMIAKQLDMTENRLIDLHVKETSQVLCFTSPAGQPLMGKSLVPDEITRLETPYVKIPKGSVAVVGNQSTIYTQESPGGWKLIGRTPIQITSPNLLPPSPFNIGDSVRFFQISEEEWDVYKGKTIEDISYLRGNMNGK